MPLTSPGRRTSNLETINKTIATLEFDMEGEISYVNQVFLDIAGYDEEELIGRRYEYLLPHEEVDKPQTRMMWMSLREGNYFTGQFRQKSKPGKELWLSGTFNPILDENGKPEKVMMFAQFNTRDKEQQSELTQYVNAMKDTLPVMELSAEGYFKNANQLFFKDLGYSGRELGKKPLEFFLQGSLSRKEINALTKRLSKDKFLEKHLVFSTKSGDKKLYRATFSHVQSLEQDIKKILVLLIEESPVLSLTGIKPN